MVESAKQRTVRVNKVLILDLSHGEDSMFGLLILQEKVGLPVSPTLYEVWAAIHIV
jgi:hypothetical protein